MFIFSALCDLTICSYPVRYVILQYVHIQYVMWSYYVFISSALCDLTMCSYPVRYVILLCVHIQCHLVTLCPRDGKKFSKINYICIVLSCLHGKVCLDINGVSVDHLYYLNCYGSIYTCN